jgi:hypothetical protein
MAAAFWKEARPILHGAFKKSPSTAEKEDKPGVEALAAGPAPAVSAGKRVGPASGEPMNLFPLSIKLYHNISDSRVSPNTTEFRFTEQLASLLPSSTAGPGKHRQCFITCKHCGRQVPLNLTESTYARISRAALSDPETGPLAHRFVVRHARFAFALFGGTLVFGLTVLGLGIVGDSLSPGPGKAIPNSQMGTLHLATLSILLISSVIVIAIGKAIQRGNLRSRPVFVRLSGKPADNETVTSLKGVTLYRVIAVVENVADGFHALSLGSDDVIYSYANRLTPMGNKKIMQEFEIFSLACENVETGGASPRGVYYGGHL